MNKLFGWGKEEDFNIDAIALLVDANDKLVNCGQNLQFLNGNKIGQLGGDVIFFDYKTFPGMDTSQYVFGTPIRVLLQNVQKLINNGDFIIHTGDFNLTGEGDNEQIIVKLNLIPSTINKILFIVCINQGKQRNQYFGQIDNAFIRVYDENGKEIARYNLSSDTIYVDDFSRDLSQRWHMEIKGNRRPKPQ